MSGEATPIGFIGQGFIGKNYADDFETRGYKIIRYALEKPYVKNKDLIKNCDIVFIAVPTPTTEKGFSFDAVRSALSLLHDDAIAVIKSTLLPGTTEMLSKEFPHLIIFHSPEFLREKTAAYDAAHPTRNIIGMPHDDERHRNAAESVMGLLPQAPYTLIAGSRTAELIKYGGNCFLLTKVMFMNMMHDLAKTTGAEYSVIAQAMAADPRIGPSHMMVVHPSGHQGALSGRGAGGHCFIKDFAAFSKMYSDVVGDPEGVTLVTALEAKNIALLTQSGKDLDLLEGVYGGKLKVKITKRKIEEKKEKGTPGKAKAATKKKRRN